MRACAVAASAGGEKGSSLPSPEDEDEDEDGRRAMRDQEVTVGMAARGAEAVVGGFRARQQKARLRMPMSTERMVVVAFFFFLSVEGGAREWRISSWMRAERMGFVPEELMPVARARCLSWASLRVESHWRGGCAIHYRTSWPSSLLGLGDCWI